MVMGPDGVSMVKENIRKFRLASTGSKADVFPKGNFLWVPSGVTKEVVCGESLLNHYCILIFFKYIM